MNLVVHPAKRAAGKNVNLLIMKLIMSNSYKKNIIVKDKKPKRWYKKVRVNNKQLVNNGKEPMLPEEVVNQYDVCDWKWILNSFDLYDKKWVNKIKRK